MRIEHLSSPGCPNAAPSYALLAQCVAELALDVPIIERVGDFPSPTVLINGIDVMRPHRPPQEICCRLDLPTHDAVIAALRHGQAHSEP